MSTFRTKTEISAGGVAFRRQRRRIEVALISVGNERRWQLPKGLIDKGEKPEDAALREVQEEAGIITRLMQPIEKIEYWYFAKQGDERVRIHKFVHFFLMEYVSGDVADHDHEVNEAQWFPIDEAVRNLAFKSEREVASKARELITSSLRTDETV
jgi:8-oxo-dGTP pyrophosphatase MutT (NUDIX family)